MGVRRTQPGPDRGIGSGPVAAAFFVLAQLIPAAAVAAPVSPLPVSSLACPAIPAADEDDVSSPPEARDEKRLPAVKVNTFGINVAIRDGNPLFFAANAGASPIADTPYPALPGPRAIEDLSFDGLLSLGGERVGVAADGVSQLVLVLRIGMAGSFTSALTPDDDESGELWLLRDGETCDSGDGHVAFAVYTAPAEFDGETVAEATGERIGRAEARSVGAIVSFTPDGSDRHLHELVDIKIVRPPVVLVHGLFDNAVDAWLTPVAGGSTLPLVLDEAGFETFLIDYTATNGRGGHPSSFNDNRHILWTDGLVGFLSGGPPLSGTGQRTRAGGIRRALEYYRDELNIAVARADVIGHSMGGVLARVYASDDIPAAVAQDSSCGATTPYNPNYRRPDNYGRGDINRLIALGTPHHGSGQPAVFELLTESDVEGESWTSWGARTLVKYGAWMAAAVSAKSPAMKDLGLESCALRRIGETRVPSHVVVAVTSRGGFEDPVYDPEHEYLKTLDYVGAFFFFSEAILDKYFGDIAGDWDPKLPETTRYAFEDMFALEAEYWTRKLKEGQDVGWITGFQDATENLFVAYASLEALRALMFRFDENDSTVRVDSQSGGLELDSGHVTYIAQKKHTASGHPPDIQASMFHRHTIRAQPVQQRVVELLRSGPERFAAVLPAAGQHMPGHPPPADFAVDWQLTGDPAVKWSGLPFSHADALLNVAVGAPTPDDDVAIMARPVNPDASALILRGAATKGMNIKGKSSNWGPQRGYLPTDQRFSKLWRTMAPGSARDAKIVEFSGLTRELLEAQKSQYQTDAGQPLAIDRQLEHCWPAPCPPADATPSTDTAIYSVWGDPQELDAEQAVYMCQGRLANGDAEQTDDARKAAERPCDCQAWFDWRNGDADQSDLTADGEFDIDTPPTRRKDPPACERLRPLRVLADATQEAQPFLTADYDLLATGFYCPRGERSADDACLAWLQINEPENPEGPACLMPTSRVRAAYGPGQPPVPMPCFDPQTGLITEAQQQLLVRLNRTIAAETGYESGNLSHHGPETQFFKSPYVDYPITVFDPTGVDGTPVIIAIPKGPPGFRDMHLKRYYERKIREGYWLYPNTYKSANWQWKPRGTTADWHGWLYEDDRSVATGEDVEELPRPACVKNAMERLSAMRRDADPPALIPCVRDDVQVASAAPPGDEPPDGDDPPNGDDSDDPDDADEPPADTMPDDLDNDGDGDDDFEELADTMDPNDQADDPEEYPDTMNPDDVVGDPPEEDDNADPLTETDSEPLFDRQHLAGTPDNNSQIGQARDRAAAGAPELDDLDNVPAPVTMEEDRSKAGKPFFDREMYNDGQDGDTAGLALRRAEAQLYNDKIEAALELYRAAYLMDKESANPDSARQAYIRERYALAQRALEERARLAGLRAGSPSLDARNDVSEEDWVAVLESIGLGRAELQKGSANIVQRVPTDASGTFFVKRYKLKGDDAALIRATQKKRAEAEVMASILMNEMGQNAPGARLVKFPGGTVGVLTHSIGKRTELKDFPEHELIAIRGDYANQRVIRALLGDGDGHYGNVVIDENGNVWNVDFELASTDGTKSTILQDWEFADSQQLIEGTIRFAHGRVEKADPRILGTDADGAEEAMRRSRSAATYDSYGWMARADQVIRLDDMDRQIGRLERLTNENYRNDLKEKFTDAGVGATSAQKMVDDLGRRAAVLRRTIEKEDMFGNGPIDISLDFDFVTVKHAGLEAPDNGQFLRWAA